MQMPLQTFLLTLSVLSSSESPIMSSDDLTEGDGVSKINEKLKVTPLAYKTPQKTFFFFTYLDYRLEDAEQGEYTESK